MHHGSSARNVPDTLARKSFSRKPGELLLGRPAPNRHATPTRGVSLGHAARGSENRPPPRLGSLARHLHLAPDSGVKQGSTDVAVDSDLVAPELHWKVAPGGVELEGIRVSVRHVTVDA